MRRLFGLGPSKEKKDSQSATATAPSSSSTAPPAVSISQRNVGLGLSLSEGSIDKGKEREDGPASPQRRSRHVQFDAELASPPLVHAPSFESRHGQATSSTTNCFPRSSNVLSQTDLRPSHPKPHAGVSGGSELQRTTSPLSTLSTSSRGSPYGLTGMNTSLSRLAERDSSQIQAPLTWSELVQGDLADNVSARERTRQEILYEVVSSEERYVAELRSLVENYVNPLLHPLLSPPSSPPSGASSPPTPRFNASPSPTPTVTSRDELPIAARFLRSISNVSTDETIASQWEPGRREWEMPEIEGSDSSHSGHHASRSRQSLPAPPRAPAPQLPSSASAASLARPEKRSGRLSSLPGFRPRHPLRPEPSGNKLLKSSSRIPAEALLPPPLPDGLRSVLETIPEMLKGHEELSNKLKDQWMRAFPLVRGLALIWSDQPWFLEVYAKYIVSLEEALETIDKCLPSTHSSYQPLTLLGKAKSQADKDTKKLARFIMTCEEAASLEGEASLAIAISKPLMRLGKLPLLMQSLLYHTDATTVEYEKTRAMALEVDALVRSIEDEKVDEDEREKVRDVLARIDGIKDKGLMAPRSSRILLEEVPLHKEDPDTSAEANHAPRRAVSDSAPIRSSRLPSSGPGPNKRSVKRMSDVLGGKSDERRDWLIRFTDVTIRCVKTSTTDIPGGFSREKEKLGKQGKTKRKGKTRNLYRFVKVEQREMREMTDLGGFVNMDDIGQSRAQLEEAPLESVESEEEDNDSFDGVSRMSFSYEADDPKPVAPRNFKDDFGRPNSRVSARSASSGTRSALAKQTPAKDKFGGRLASSSLGPNRRFEAPTAASLARATASTNRISSAPAGRVASPASMPPPSISKQTTNTPALVAPAKRGLSSPAMPSSTAPSNRSSAVRTEASSSHERGSSTLGVYEAFWKGEPNPVPFPRT